MFNSNYSLADIAAATGRNGSSDGWGSGDGWWIILLFLFSGFGWGGRGFGGGGATGSTTVREEIAYGFDMNGLENSIRGIQQGLCDGFYAMNTGMLNGFSGVQSTLCQGFAGVNTAINQSAVDAMQNTFGLQTALTSTTNVLSNGIHDLSTQIASCCCDTKAAIGDLNYNIATQACDTRRAIADSTRDIVDNANANYRAIIDFLTQDKIASLTAENQSLKFAASQAAQNAYLVGELRDKCPIPAYVVPNPNCCYNPTVFGFNTCANI